MTRVPWPGHRTMIEDWEVYNWLVDNISKEDCGVEKFWRFHTYNEIEFENDQDALAFRLRFNV